MTDSDRIAALEADNADLRARLQRAELAAYIGEVCAEAGITITPRRAGIGVTRLPRRPNPAGLYVAAGGAP